MRKHVFIPTNVAVLAVILSGCNSVSIPDTTVPSTPPSPAATLAVIHASPDAPNLNIAFGDANGDVSYDVPFAGAASVDGLPAGTYSLSIDALNPVGLSPLGASNPVAAGIATPSATVAVNTRTTILLAKNYASLATLSVTQAVPFGGNGLGSASVGVVDAAGAAAGSYDVYLTAVNASLSDAAPVAAGAGYGTIAGDALYPAGSSQYRVRVTDAGTQTVVYDSGTDNPVTFASSATVLVQLLDNPSTVSGSSPFFVGVYDGMNNKTYPDAAHPVAVAKFANAVVGSTLDVGFDIPGSDPLAFSTVSSGLAYGGTHYECSIARQGELTVDFLQSGAVQANLESGVNPALDTNTSFIASGTDVASGQTFRSSNDDRARANEARIKFFNASPSNDPVNVYIAAAGTYSSSDISSGDVDASAYADSGDGSLQPAPVAYGAEATFPDANASADPEPTDGFLYLQPYLELPAGSYDVWVTSPNDDGKTQTILLSQTGLALANGDVRTLIATDSTSSLVSLDNAQCP